VKQAGRQSTKADVVVSGSLSRPGHEFYLVLVQAVLIIELLIMLIIELVIIKCVSRGL
jgi:hypothetical protein